MILIFSRFRLTSAFHPEVTNFRKNRSKDHNRHSLPKGPLIVHIYITSRICQSLLDASKTYDSPQLRNSEKRNSNTQTPYRVLRSASLRENGGEFLLHAFCPLRKASCCNEPQQTR